MPDLATLQLTWEPRMLSILRIVVGVLYMEHGLAKILDFPHQPNHTLYAPFTLNPGLQGLLELVGGLLLALGSPPHSCGIKTDFASPRDRTPSAWTASTGRSLRTAPEPRSRRRLSRSRWGISYNYRSNASV